jgi:hypothetical protein
MGYAMFCTKFPSFIPVSHARIHDSQSQHDVQCPLQAIRARNVAGYVAQDIKPVLMPALATLVKYDHNLDHDGGVSTEYVWRRLLKL